MCGIFCLLCKEYEYINYGYNSILTKRGPDSTQIKETEYCIFVFHRLSINDTSEAGNQPMQLDDITLVANGEIYNHKELQEKYDIKCTSNSDCEIILHLYKKIGFEETIKQLYGVFAIVLVDKNKVYIARDRIGVRPLYLGTTGRGHFAVSSVPNALSPFCVSISQFPQGMSSCIDLHEHNIIYTLYKDELILPKLRIQPDLDILKHTLINAVKLRLLSDRPMCTLLSGGLDSSLVTSILCRLVGSENVRTYSIGMLGSTDLKYAKKVADFLGTKHTEVIFTPEQGFSAIPNIIEAIGSYDITTVRASVGMYLLAKYISENTTDKVVFTGEGSDELFQGYLYFHKAPTPEEGEEESLRLLQELPFYDVLRADRCISVNGLEPRVPFLDRKLVDLVLSFESKYKTPKEKYEKYILRKAFENKENPYLPEDVLWRRKEGFSDGVSSMEKPWYSYIQEYVDKKIPNEIYDCELYPSKEAYYYRLIFNKIFKKYDTNTPYWMPKWCDNIKDPSGRVIEI